MAQQFLLWTDDQFIGTARSSREARAIALRQDPGAMVNVCDFDQPPAAQFSIDPGSGARVIGGLGWNNCLRGVLLAATALSDDATAKRAVMEDSLGAIWSQKPVATQGALQAVQEAEDVSKLRRRFT